MKSSESNTLTNKPVSIRKVLVAVNLSDRSEATATYAAQIAKYFDAALTIAFVYEPVPLCEYASETTFTLLEDQRDNLQKLLEELTRKIQKTGLVCTSAFLVGDPAEQISAIAHDLGADLLVTASHHRTFLGGVFNLNKAPQIMHRAPCPVLIYHDKYAVDAGTGRRSFGTLKGAKQPELELLELQGKTN